MPRCENRTELRLRVVRAFENLANGFGGVNQMIRIVTLVELHSIVTLRHCRWDGFDSRHQRWLFITAVVLALIDNRSEEHTSELQSLMRISYAVFCLKNKKIIKQKYIDIQQHTTHTSTVI